MINDFKNIHFCPKVKTILSEHLKECSECRTALSVINEKVLSLPFIGMLLSESERQQLNNIFLTIIKG